MSFFKQVGAVLSNVAAEANKKAKETYAYLSAPPEQVTCLKCDKPVIVPPAIFNWTCPQCSLDNLYKNEVCSACNAARVKVENKEYTVQCTICHELIVVPTTNAMKGLKEAGHTTKKYAILAKDKAKAQYEYMKSVPKTFTCEHCNTQLHNPNWHEVDYVDPDEKNAAAAISPNNAANPNPAPSAPPAEAEAEAAPQAGAQGSELESHITSINCPVCKKVTKVPGSNFANSVTSSSIAVSRSAEKVYFAVSSKKYADCPVCQNHVEVPPLPPAANAGAATGGAGDTAASSPAATAAPANAAPVKRKVDLLCKKCSTAFPAVVDG